MKKYILTKNGQEKMRMTDERGKEVSMTDLLTSFPRQRIFAFYGQMGAGKTTFIKQLCLAMGTTDIVNSPTFAIVNVYEDKRGQEIYHFDCYRLKNLQEAMDMGSEDYLYSGNYCFIEWYGDDSRAIARKLSKSKNQDTRRAHKSAGSRYNRTISMTFALLRTRLHKTAIEQLCHEIETDESGKRKEELFALLSDNEKRVAEQAAWAMTHLKKNEDQWLQQKQNELIDKLLQTESNTMKRLLPALLLRTEFTQEDERGDFLEYCMARILQLKEPVGVRMACMKLAYEQCKFYPELLQELRMTLEIMPSELLTAGLRSSQKHVLQKINRQLKTFETKPVGN